MFSDSAYHPSVCSFERLSLPASLQRTMAVYCSCFVVFSQLGLLNVALNAILWMLLLVLMLPLMGIEQHGALFADPNYLVAHVGSFYALMGANTVVSLIINALVNGAMTRAVADMYLGKEPTFAGCLRLGVKHAPTILVTSVLSLTASLIGYFFFVVPGLYINVLLFCVNPAIVMEGLGIWASMKRSCGLVMSNWCYVFCTFFIGYIFMIALQTLWSMAVVGGTDAGHTMFSFGGSILAAIPSILFVPVLSIMMSIMYINLRIEQEGLNADLLARNMGESSGEALYSQLIDQDDHETGDIRDVMVDMP